MSNKDNPYLQVPCPTCHAKIGQWCKRPSGWKAMELHVGRIKDAEQKMKETK